MMTHKAKWLIFAPAGLLTVGAGACLVGWATTLKAQNVPTKQWVGAGTAALVVLNAGLSLFGHGVAENVLHQLDKEPTQEG